MLPPLAGHSGVPGPDHVFPLQPHSGKMKRVQREGKQPAGGVRQEPAPGIPVAVARGRMQEGTVPEGCLQGDGAPLEPISALRLIEGSLLCPQVLCGFFFWRGLGQEELEVLGRAELQPPRPGKLEAGTQPGSIPGLLASLGPQSLSSNGLKHMPGRENQGKSAGRESPCTWGATTLLAQTQHPGVGAPRGASHQRKPRVHFCRV